MPHITQYKYRGREAFTPIFQRMMGQAYKRMAAELSSYPHTGNSWHIDAVTYVPLSPSRLRERGFNQAELLAIGVAAAAKAPLIDILERTRDTQKMSLKSRHQRLTDMRGVFRTNPQARSRLTSLIQTRATSDDVSLQQHLQILLIDDVYTTGSTVKFCTAALQETCSAAGMTAEIFSLTWARS